MSRYIDADKVLDSLEQLRKSPWANDEHLTPMRLAVKESLDIVRDICIKDEPTADVKEVVYCCECENYKAYNHTPLDFDGKCLQHETEMCNYDYCSYGKRMSDMRGEHNDE